MTHQMGITTIDPFFDAVKRLTQLGWKIVSIVSFIDSVTQLTQLVRQIVSIVSDGFE